MYYSRHCFWLHCAVLFHISLYHLNTESPPLVNLVTFIETIKTDNSNNYNLIWCMHIVTNKWNYRVYAEYTRTRSLKWVTHTSPFGAIATFWLAGPWSVASLLIRLLFLSVMITFGDYLYLPRNLLPALSIKRPSLRVAEGRVYSYEVLCRSK